MTKEEREKAIDLLDNLIGMVEDNQDNDYDKALKMGIESLRKEPTQKWIPVSERLPEDGQRVFVTQTFERRTIVYCTRFPFDKTKEKYIIAWMPLPDGYKKEKESEDGN